MATFVLVTGAWHGAWCWKRVRKGLIAQGHTVFTPTFTGIGERSHLASPQVDLETHIADIMNLIRWEELTDIVLVGHSYGGCVVRSVADRMPDRIRALVYLDAFTPEHGQSLHDTLPPEQRGLQVEGAAQGEGWRVPPIPAAVFNVNEADRLGRRPVHGPADRLFPAEALPHRRARARPRPLHLGLGLGRLALRPVLRGRQSEGLGNPRVRLRPRRHAGCAGGPDCRPDGDRGRLSPAGGLRSNTAHPGFRRDERNRG